MRHLASPAFWDNYRKLPDRVRELADKNFALLKSDPRHPSLHFKKVNRYWSLRTEFAIARSESNRAVMSFGFG